MLKKSDVVFSILLRFVLPWLTQFVSMPKSRFSFLLPLFLSSCFFLYYVIPKEVKVSGDTLKFPYKSQGLSQREAAAHLISRFTYGARPGQIDEVVNMGLEKWFQLQLQQGFNEDTVQARLSGYQFLKLTNEEAFNTFPRPLQILRRAAADGVIPKDSIRTLDRNRAKELLKDYEAQHNIHKQSELVRELVNQHIVRATYSNNQLQEVMTGFWFNHFNVSLTKNTCIVITPAYERDVIRPHTLGKFSDLLLATAQSPAMLVYLDNNLSVGDNDSLQNPESNKRLLRLMDQYQQADDTAKAALVEKIKKAQNNKGLNENYAREVMELHTLGVDGGYTQSDVTQAARVLTGWGLYPIEESYAPAIRRLLDAVGEEKLKERGFVHEGDFMFAMSRHDIKPKKVLGREFPAGGGYEEGKALLQMLAHHPSTAQFISRKLATYFVSDHPPQSLVDKMADAFLKKDGDIKAVLVAMVNAPEFWSKTAIRQKIKSPFELAISAARALDADLMAPYALFGRMDKMGQKIYYYQAPTGFPDRADYWINTGSLLQRMNFGLDIAAGNVRGVSVDLLKLNQYQEPENASAALKTYAPLLMPERDLGPTIKRLTPLLTDPELSIKVIRKIPQQKATAMEADDEMPSEKMTPAMNKNYINMLAQVVGIIIGSPEFQRR